MPYSRSIRISLNLKDVNIQFEEEFCKDITIKENSAKAYYAKLTYTPERYPNCGMKDTIHHTFILKLNTNIAVSMFHVILRIKYGPKIEKKSAMSLRLFIRLIQSKKLLPFYPVWLKKQQKAYPKVTHPLIENQNLLTFYEFPPSIRRTIYSTNLIESFNKQIKKYSRRKEQFQNEESLERFLVSLFDTYNQKFLNRSHKGFLRVTDTLASMFTV